MTWLLISWQDWLDSEWSRSRIRASPQQSVATALISLARTLISTKLLKFGNYAILDQRYCVRAHNGGEAWGPVGFRCIARKDEHEYKSDSCGGQKRQQIVHISEKVRMKFAVYKSRHCGANFMLTVSFTNLYNLFPKSPNLPNYVTVTRITTSSISYLFVESKESITAVNESPT